MRLEDGKQGGEEDGGHRELDRDAPERLTLRALPSEDHGPDSETGRGPHYLQRSPEAAGENNPRRRSDQHGHPDEPNDQSDVPESVQPLPGKEPQHEKRGERGATAIRMAERFPDVVASPTYSR